jgi:hypothetical protein
MARKSFRVGSILVSSALVVGLSLWGCGGSSDTGAGDSGDSGDDSGDDSGGSSSSGASNRGGSTAGGSTGMGGASGSSGSAGSSTGTGGSDWCSSGGCICANGLDDDGDGLVDGLDPECTGPLDNDEGTFATGIPGDNRDPKWQDCFFDGNSGAGDDGCRYATECLYGELEQDDPDCVQSQECIDFCRRLTPNGCDCFGCCTIMDEDGEQVNVMVGSTCSVANIDDEEACPRCVKTTECGNDCGECELCLGKTVEDLPASCTPPPPDGGVPDGGYPDSGPDGGYTPPPPNTCDNGEIVCDLEHPCPMPLYCSLGCCIEIVR